MTLRHLPAGRWDVSLQYLSYAPLDLRAGALGRRLPRGPEGFGPYRAVGVLDHAGGVLTVRVRAARARGLARLLGAEPAPTVAQTVSGQPLHALAFTRHGYRPRRVPIEQACGHWVAWLDPTPA